MRNGFYRFPAPDSEHWKVRRGSLKRYTSERSRSLDAIAAPPRVSFWLCSGLHLSSQSR